MSFLSCAGCEVTLVKAITDFQDRAKTIEFLSTHGIIATSVNCSECGKGAVLSKDLKFWRCQKKREIIRGKKKKVTKKCNFMQSVRSDSWLENSHLSPEKCCTFLAMYIMIPPPHYDFLEAELQMGRNTICDWASFVREILEDWCLKNSTSELGGPGKIVEIDEAKFGQRKYNRGRIIDGQWLFGGFERGSKHIFVEKVEDRTSTTLLEVINRRIKPGTTIMSDCWKAYRCLSEEGKHYSVIHPFIHSSIHSSLHRIQPFDRESFHQFR